MVLLIIFKENTITEPKEIVEIKNSTEDTLSDDLKIKIFLYYKQIDSFIFFTSASELLRAAPAIFDYPICIPFKRVRQLRATANGFEHVSPSTWNIIVYGPPLDQVISDVDKSTLFYNTFRDIGRICFNEFAGDNWNKDLEYYNEKRGNV